jgi:hypothetical protein
MDPNRRLFLARAGSVGVASLLSPAAAPGCWPRRRRVQCPMPAGGYAVPAPSYAPPATGYAPTPVLTAMDNGERKPACYPNNDLTIQGIYYKGTGSSAKSHIVADNKKLYDIYIKSSFFNNHIFICEKIQVKDLLNTNYKWNITTSTTVNSNPFRFTVRCQGTDNHGGSGELVVTVSLTPNAPGECPSSPWPYHSTNNFQILYSVGNQ